MKLKEIKQTDINNATPVTREQLERTSNSLRMYYVYIGERRATGLITVKVGFSSKNHWETIKQLVRETENTNVISVLAPQVKAKKEQPLAKPNRDKYRAKYRTFESAQNDSLGQMSSKTDSKDIQEHKTVVWCACGYTDAVYHSVYLGPKQHFITEPVAYCQRCGNH